MGPGRAAGIRWESRRGTGRCNDEDDEFSGWSGGGLTSTSTTEDRTFLESPGWRGTPALTVREHVTSLGKRTPDPKQN